MTTAELRADMRRLCGNPNVNEVNDVELDSFLRASLTWLASELDFDIVTDTQIPVVANQREYPLPKQFAAMVFVDFNGTLLIPVSVWFLNSPSPVGNFSGSGGNWRTTPAGAPARFAIQGRQLILNPPADSTTATNVPTMTWRYFGTGEAFPNIESVELSELDQQLVKYDAAIGWCSSHVSEENTARIANYKAEIDRRMPQARKRWENASEVYYPILAPETQGRFRAARHHRSVMLGASGVYRYTSFRGGRIPWTSLTSDGYGPESELEIPRIAGIG